MFQIEAFTNRFGAAVAREGQVIDVSVPSLGAEKVMAVVIGKSFRHGEVILRVDREPPYQRTVIASGSIVFRSKEPRLLSKKTYIL